MPWPSLTTVAGTASQAVVPPPNQVSTSESSAGCAKQTRPAKVAPAVTANSKLHPQQASYLKANTSTVKQLSTAATAASCATTGSPLPAQQALSIQPNQGCSIDAAQQVFSTAAASATSSHIKHPQQALSTEAQATLNTDATQQVRSTVSRESTTHVAKALLSQVLQAVPAQALQQTLAVRAGSASCCSSGTPCIPVEATKQFLAELHSTQLFQAVEEQLADMLHASGPHTELHSTELPSVVQMHLQQQLQQQLTDNSANTGIHSELQSTGSAQAVQRQLADRSAGTDPRPVLHSTELFPAVQYKSSDMLTGKPAHAETHSPEAPKKLHQQAADTPTATGTGAEQFQSTPADQQGLTSVCYGCSGITSSGIDKLCTAAEHSDGISQTRQSSWTCS